MKTASVSLAILAVIVLGAFLASGNAAADRRAPRLVYLAMGDNVAVGEGASDPDKTAYVPIFYDYLEEMDDIRLVNVARSFETSGSLIADGQLEEALDVINDRKSNVKVVSIHVGGNDLLAPLLPGAPCDVNPGSPECSEAFASALTGFAENYERILQALTKALAKDPGREALMVQTVYNPFPFQPIKTLGNIALEGWDGTIDCAANASDPTRVGLNDIIACIGGLHGTTLVDVYPIFANKALLLTNIRLGDGNPNDRGHALIADEFVNVISRGDDCGSISPLARKRCNPDPPRRRGWKPKMH